MQMRVQNRDIDIEAFVINGKGPGLILGHPVFYRTGWLIDIRNSRLVEPNEREMQTSQDLSRVSTVKQEKQVVSHELNAHVDIHIAPKSHVKILQDFPVPNGYRIVFTERDSLRANCRCLILDNETGIFIVNMGEQPIVVLAGAHYEYYFLFPQDF